MSVIGLIHHNKSGASDPLDSVMASRAFTAVARSVHTVVRDPDDDTRMQRLFGTPKNNLGRSDLPTLRFRIDSATVDTKEGPTKTGKLVWLEESEESIFDAMRRATETPEQKSAADEAKEWLRDYLSAHGGSAESATIKKAAQSAGHRDWAVQRARKTLGLVVTNKPGPGHATVSSLPATENPSEGGADGSNDRDAGTEEGTTVERLIDGAVPYGESQIIKQSNIRFENGTGSNRTFDYLIVQGSPREDRTNGQHPPARLAFDLETTGTDLWSSGPGFIRIAGVRCDGGEVRATTNIGEVVELLRHSEVIVGHNIAAFDLVALARHHKLDIFELAERGAIRDTLILASLNDPPAAHMTGKVDRRYDLDTLGAQLVGEGKHGDLKALAKELGGYDKIPLEDSRFLEYLRRDVIVTDKLVDVLPWTAYGAREHRVASIAAMISITGFKVDTELLARRCAEIAEARALAAERLTNGHAVPDTNKAGDPAKSPLATDEGREAIRASFERLGVSRYPKTPSGKPSTSAADMDKLIKKYGQLPGVTELAELVQEVVTQPRVYDTIAKHLHGDRVHPMINIRQSAGRWSVTQPGINVVGKRDAELIHQREVFLPEVGEVLLAFDLATVDARAVAALSQDPGYMEIFQSGRDLHTEVALQVFGDAGMREQAKRASHGYNYGMSVDGIVGLGVERKLAEQFVREMRANFPRLEQWKREVREIAKSGELLDNGFGRLMRPDPVRAWTQAPALMGQGCARDLLMEGLLRLPPNILPMLRAQVHDEIVISAPKDAVEDVTAKVLEALQFQWRGVPIVAEPQGPGRNWADVYRKES
jgi:DNA polymerase-1